MNKEISQALDFIKVIGDRAVFKGNIFVNVDEVQYFINSYNLIFDIVRNLEQLKHEHLKGETS